MCTVGLTGTAISQTIIKNSEKPSNPKAGRVLKLQEELRITDEGGEFFFQHPRLIQVAPDGSCFIYDQERLLRFDPKGIFLHNFFKKGQGPGELNSVSNFDFVQDLLLVHNNSPNKFVWFALDGAFIKELPLHDIGRLDFLFCQDGILHGFKTGQVDTEGRMEEVGIPHILLAISEDGTTKKELLSFPIQTLSVGGAWVSTTGLLSVPHLKRYLFVSHTPDYLVKLCDVRSGDVVRSFTRAYKRIKRPKDSRSSAIIIGGKRYEAPGSEYLNDIAGMFVHKDVLWVLTSTENKEKGFLIDVFDFNGKYVDAFYLDTHGRIIGTHGDSIFVREKDENELVSVVKFRIVDE
ncbi:MAG: hypothetical protein WBC70_04040 [Candidatus Aminicenantales bacterium]